MAPDIIFRGRLWIQYKRFRLAVFAAPQFFGSFCLHVRGTCLLYRRAAEGGRRRVTEKCWERVLWVKASCVEKSDGCGSKCKVRSRPFQGSWSRPLIQTFGMIEYMGELMSGLVMVACFLGFLLCSYSPCPAAKQQTVVKPRCQAVKLPSCTCCKATLLSSQTALLVKPRC